MSGRKAQADDRGQHQHALLNLANFYYTTGGLDSAKAVSGDYATVLADETGHR